MLREIALAQEQDPFLEHKCDLVYETVFIFFYVVVTIVHVPSPVCRKVPTVDN